MTDALAVAIPASIVALLIVLNGLFVAAEFAIVGAPRAAIAARAGRGERTGRMVNGVLTEPRNQDRYIATAQLGITFATLGLGMYGEHQLAHWIEGQLDGWAALPTWVAAHTMATVMAITVMTYFHVVIGEMVPKALALEHAEGTALRVTPPMLWLRRLMFPLVVGLNAIGNGLLKLIGIDRAAGSEEQYYSTEELEFVVQESLKSGMLGDGSGQILRELFDLGGLVAEDVMTPRVQVEGLRIGTTPADMQRMLAEHAHTRYPVYGENMDEILGVIHVRRIAELVESERPLDRDGVRDVPFVPDSTPLPSVVKRMRSQDVQFAVVIDEHGGTAGIITPDDITDEILGRIPEGDGLGEMFRDAAERLHVAGTVRLDELSERLQVQLEHPEADTVSGLVLALLERPPHIGDVVEYDDVELRVVEVQGRGVAQVIATPLVPPPGD